MVEFIIVEAKMFYLYAIMVKLKNGDRQSERYKHKEWYRVSVSWSMDVRVGVRLGVGLGLWEEFVARVDCYF